MRQMRKQLRRCKIVIPLSSNAYGAVGEGEGGRGRQRGMPGEEGRTQALAAGAERKGGALSLPGRRWCVGYAPGMPHGMGLQRIFRDGRGPHGGTRYRRTNQGCGGAQRDRVP
jgi:hypothetical protein